MSWINKLLYDRDFLVIIWSPPHASICQNTKNLLDPTKLYKFCGPGGILTKFFLGSSCTLIKYPFLFLNFHVPSLWPNGLSGFPGAYWQAHKARLVLCRLAWIYFSADLLSTFDHRTFYQSYFLMKYFSVALLNRKDRYLFHFENHLCFIWWMSPRYVSNLVMKSFTLWVEGAFRSN